MMLPQSTAPSIHCTPPLQSIHNGWFKRRYHLFVSAQMLTHYISIYIYVYAYIYIYMSISISIYIYM